VVICALVEPVVKGAQRSLVLGESGTARVREDREGAGSRSETTTVDPATATTRFRQWRRNELRASRGQLVRAEQRGERIADGSGVPYARCRAGLHRPRDPRGTCEAYFPWILGGAARCRQLCRSDEDLESSGGSPYAARHYESATLRAPAGGRIRARGSALEARPACEMDNATRL